ncbi:MAG: hypothetical protein M3R10_02535 [Verrucomicrobiota bacterium]|nr:hypothetical protein [Verrucomicrobiota bacterium]
MQTVPAEIDEQGNVKLLGKLNNAAKTRAFVTVFDKDEAIAETTLLSEPALAEDWSRPEEEEAWSHLNAGQ